MNEKEEKHLVPKLRFPEFKKSEKWEEKKFSKLFEFKPINVYSRDQLSYDNGLIKNIHYGDIHTKFRTLFDITKERVPFINENQDYNNIKKESYCKEGDIIFADASEDTSDVGKSIEIVNLNGQKIVSGLHTIFARPIIDNFIIGFKGYLFKSNFIRKQIQRESQGTKVYSISTGRLSNIRISYPVNKSEQQKIADCLSSLDECISAETRKLESLRLHKKGLMQNLFPAEGESVPKLRFPEFKKSGKWEEKKLGDVANIITGNTPSTSKASNYGGSFQFVSPGDIFDGRYVNSTKNTLTEEGFSETRPIKANSILFVCIGSTIGKIAQNKIDCATNQQINSVIPLSKYSNEFIYSILEFNAKKIASLAGRHAVPIINKTDFSNTLLFFPSLPEQQKIADCLSSLDEYITSQSQNIESLKLHKKGLMQQLFPSKEDGN